MRENHPLRLWRQGQPTVGAWLTTPSGHTAEVLAHAGFDWLCIDAQHGLVDYASMVEMLRAISTTATTPLVRVSWNDPAEIMRALDAGAYGVVVPLINSKADAERAIGAARYPPIGNRSAGPIRAALYGGADYADRANEEIAVVCMIETAAALENLDEILSTEGLDAIYIGPSDLAYALGLKPTGDNAEPEHVATVKAILEACQRHGVAAGIHTGSVDYANQWLSMGFQMVTLGSDTGFLRRRAAQELAAIRKPD